MADKTRGFIIEPGGYFSPNEIVGPRTSAAGFATAGAIENGEHVDVVGGGVSQFATTSFNAAFFAGLDIPNYFMHDEYFSRYPYGRESTISYPEPEFRIQNNTPYGVLVWPEYTDTSITMRLYSTRYATGCRGRSDDERGGQLHLCDDITGPHLHRRSHRERLLQRRLPQQHQPPHLLTGCHIWANRSLRSRLPASPSGSHRPRCTAAGAAALTSARTLAAAHAGSAGRVPM